jgi:hypothetical protein
LKKVVLHVLYRAKSEMTETYFQLRYIQTSSRNAVNKKLFLTSLLFLARSYRDVQHTNFQMSLTIKIVRQ